jgi:SAM-dependent methyltransferase
MRGLGVTVHDTPIHVVEIREEAPLRIWADYHRSKMPELIGAMHLCYALFALEQSGMAAKLQVGPTPKSELLAGLNPEVAENFLKYLGIRGVLAEEGNSLSLTKQGTLLLASIPIAQLGFYLEAYGPVTRRMDELLRGEATYGVTVERNGEALGRHCATLSPVFHTPIVLDAVRRSGARYLLDLGCGAGKLLIDACRRDADLRGAGLDISPEAIELARGFAEREGLADRLDFVVGDAFAPETWPEVCRSADSLCAVGVVHERFRDGDEAVIDILNRYADLLREGMTTFILGEPELCYDNEENDADLFLVHIFTAQGFPRSRDQWLRLFEQTELTCRRVITRPNAGPRFCFYELMPNDRTGT